MAEKEPLFKLRALKSFVDTGNGTPGSISKGRVFWRREERGRQLVASGKAEQVMSDEYMMVECAQKLGDVYFLTNNPEVTRLCGVLQVPCTAVQE